jgi:hypothetical protein
VTGYGAQEHARGRVAAIGLAGLALVATGAVLGRALRSAPPRAERTTVTVQATSTTGGSAPRTVDARTRAGAAAVAGRALVAFGGESVLEPSSLSTILHRFAAPSARPGLEAVYSQAETSLRTRFGLAGQPKPVVLVRTVPLGYHVDSFSSKRAEVAVWTLAVLGSGATFDPVASWRTQTVQLVWQKGAWKVVAFGSANGPTPALADGQQPSTPVELFTAIPRMQEFAHVAP